ncbi:MAG: hypothetical protein ACYTFZ_07715 [Planctomycetota bacterium]
MPMDLGPGQGAATTLSTALGPPGVAAKSPEPLILKLLRTPHPGASARASKARRIVGYLCGLVS